ncbi:MAG: SdiA-regulated domain-containing protein [Saprospiraceae bacterium]|nr:SdiA-regulated domain-containing protein [Saprospiraceae bacterium]
MGFARYLINQPDTSFLLPTTLDEISGLSLSHQNDHLVGVQDEQGKLFFISKTTGKLVNDVKFGGGDDYEGVEVVDSLAYVINSKGNFDIINLSQLASPKQTMKTFLNSSDDVEGLGRLHNRRALLVACKSYRSKKDKNRKVYLLDLDSMMLDSTPFIVLDNRQIADALDRESITPLFSPSGISVDPRSGEIYVISSAAKALVILSNQGKLLGAVKLDGRIHKQPEGITIDHNGKLYITNEARGGSAKLHVFNPN